MTIRSLARLLAAVGFAAVALLTWPAAASAHAGDQPYLYLDVTETTIGGRVETPIRDLSETFDLDLLGRSDTEILSTVEANLDLLEPWLQDHVDVGSTVETWTLSFTDVELLFPGQPAGSNDDNYVLFHFTTSASDLIPRQLEVSFDPFIDDIPGRDALLLISNDWQSGVIDNEGEWLAAFDAGTRTQVIDLGGTSWLKNFTSSIKLGINHIRSGPDHILFVLVLLLPSVLIYTTRWQPTRSFGASLWRTLKVVTMFTVAHSITFTLAGLDILVLPPARVIESIIAISIAAAALHNIRPLAANKEWMISFAFGLFHGMGFASLVSGLDVDRETQLISLLGRNAGIEVGQSVVVVLLFPGLFLLRRTRYFRSFFVVLSSLLAAISVGWMVERLIDAEHRFELVVRDRRETRRAARLLDRLRGHGEDRLAGVLHQVLGKDRFVGDHRPDVVLARHVGRGEHDQRQPKFFPKLFRGQVCIFLAQIRDGTGRDAPTCTPGQKMDLPGVGMRGEQFDQIGENRR